MTVLRKRLKFAVLQETLLCYRKKLHSLHRQETYFLRSTVRSKLSSSVGNSGRQQFLKHPSLVDTTWLATTPWSVLTSKFEVVIIWPFLTTVVWQNFWKLSLFREITSRYIYVIQYPSFIEPTFSTHFRKFPSLHILILFRKRLVHWEIEFRKKS